MTNFNDISEDFETPYIPFKALVFYNQESKAGENPLYIESYDISETGNPINAHPLSLSEMGDLKDVIINSQGGNNAFLHIDGLLPANLLYLNTAPNEENAVWFTGTAERRLYFVDNLRIPSGQLAKVPAMISPEARAGAPEKERRHGT